MTFVMRRDRHAGATGVRVYIRAVGIAVLFAACRPAPAPTSYPGELMPPEQMQPDMMLRQHVTGHYGERTLEFDAVVQKRGEELLLLALTPYGSRALLVRQRGREVEVQKFVPQELPFEPRVILLDVQRVFYQGLGETPRADGWHRGRRGEESIREYWKDGRLFERQYRRRDRNPDGVITVRYEGGYAREQVPARIELENGWFGYRLTLETLEHKPL